MPDLERTHHREKESPVSVGTPDLASLELGTQQVKGILGKLKVGFKVPTPEEFNARIQEDRNIVRSQISAAREEEYNEILAWLSQDVTGRPPLSKILQERLRDSEIVKDFSDPVMQERFRALQKVQYQLSSDPKLRKTFNRFNGHTEDEKKLQSDFQNAFLDALVRFKNNPAKLLDAFKVGGSDITDENGKKAMVFSMDQIGEGAMGSIARAVAFLENKGCVDVVMKKPLVGGGMDVLMRRGYEREVEIARHVRRFDDKRSEIGGGNILSPMIISQVPQGALPELGYDLVSDSDGKSRTLYESINEPNFPRSRVIDGFGEVCLGMNWLHERGMIHGDVKPENMMMSADGRHKLIDLGGVIREQDIQSGSVLFADIPISTNQTACVAFMNGTSCPTTPYYNDHATLKRLIAEGKPIQAVDKRAMGVVVREALADMKYFDIKDFEGIDITNDQFAPLKMKVRMGEDIVSGIPPHVQTVYDVACKLINSADHPYQYRDNDSSKGLDPDYISLTDTAKILKDAAKDFK